MEKLSIEEAAEILVKAEEIKKDATLLKAAQEHMSKKAKSIGSISDLRKMNSKGLTMKDLMTEEDKSSLQDKIITDGKMAEMGFTVKDPVDMEDEEESEEEEND